MRIVGELAAFVAAHEMNVVDHDDDDDQSYSLSGRRLA